MDAAERRPSQRSFAVTGDVLGGEAAEMKKFGNAFFEPRRIRW
jgi:hypothetical protein